MTKTLAFVLTATLAACAGEAEVHYSGDAAAPELVTLDIDPSIQVVANADEPIFFVENEYYLYRDSHWYRSRSHRKGWARIETPPDHIRRIERPMAYVHFRHGTDQQRTTFNQREQVEPQRPQPIERERTQPEQLPSAPMREPNSQGPNQPYANPLPPQQVPPSPDNDPILRGQPSRPMPPDPVPSANTDREHPDHPDHPSNPGLERSQNAPGQNRAADRARDQGDHSKRRPDPEKTKDKDKDKDKDRDSDENK